jgi:DNA topoisomerase IA
MEEHGILSERLEEQLKAVEWAKAEQKKILQEVSKDTMQAIDNVENKRNLSKEFSSVKDLMEDLNAED